MFTAKSLEAYWLELVLETQAVNLTGHTAKDTPGTSDTSGTSGKSSTS